MYGLFSLPCSQSVPSCRVQEGKSGALRSEGSDLQSEGSELAGLCASLASFIEQLKAAQAAQRSQHCHGSAFFFRGTSDCALALIKPLPTTLAATACLTGNYPWLLITMCN